ncbi:NADH-ubiquinone oxidoreductase chain 5, partial [Trachymyrmex zeteki]
ASVFGSMILTGVLLKIGRYGLIRLIEVFYISYNSAMVTVLCNRIGDVGILITIGLLIIVASVSALVHSSTLVTAGAYLIIRFHKFLMKTDINIVLCFISVITIFIAGLKIILKKLLRILAFYHLLIHAIFKSILFIAAGSIIHLIKNNQDIRLLGNLNETLPCTIIRLLVSP